MLFDLDAFSVVTRTLGRLDLVVNNAGIADEGNWRKTIDIDLVSQSSVYNIISHKSSLVTFVCSIPVDNAYTSLIVSSSCIYVLLLFCGVRIESMTLNAYTTKQYKCI